MHTTNPLSAKAEPELVPADQLQPKTVLDYFLQWEQEQPDAVFLRQPSGQQWETFTWAEVGRQARCMASALRAKGLKEGDHVGILSKNCYHWIIADLALLMGGFVSVPFYPNLTAEQLAEVIRLSNIRLLFVGKLEEWEQQQAGIPDDLPLLRFPHYPGNSRVEQGADWEAMLAAHAPLEIDPVRPLDDLYTILFTSGTTGSPKGVMITHRAPATLMANEKAHNNLRVFEGDEHRFFSYLPLNHIAERVIVEAAAIMTGGTISFAESIDTFAQNLQDTQPTLFMAVPRIWTKFQLGILSRMPQSRLDLILRIPIVNNLIRRKIRQGLGLSRARILLTGAAPTPQPLKDWFQRLGLELQEVYAMTENCGGCTLMRKTDRKEGTVGTALPNVELRIEEGTNEVCMRAPWLMAGYYDQPEKTAEVLREGWLHTGDQGSLDEDGHLRLTGRVSDTFKSGKGKYIIPAPIEWGFSRNPHIEQICIVGSSLPQPIALVVLSEIGLRAEKQEVETGLLQTLEAVNQGQPKYARIPKLVVLREGWSVDNGMLTPTMKIKRNALNQRYEDHYQEWYAAEAPIVWAAQDALA